MNDAAALILASTSPYRKQLLGRLGLPFAVVAPQVEETPLPGEEAEQLARRLSEAKAQEVAMRHPQAWVIGSDQVAELDGRIFGKPGSAAGAVEQLQTLSGRQVRFWTGLCLCNHSRQITLLEMATFDVRFRPLSQKEIVTYVERDQPFNCAGSFRSEGLGIALFEEMIGPDPSILMGLPLIRLCHLLSQVGMPVLDP
ncbi:MAG: septum formation inhibitor Maf [Magnetococcales bacterium]|nr:septum formation inhibitor Maf [Magnetococcales bacterium]NGZ26655.1 septum formation inhibitor Maf [Magnetococcales bacterium]